MGDRGGGGGHALGFQQFTVVPRFDSHDDFEALCALDIYTQDEN